MTARTPAGRRTLGRATVVIGALVGVLGAALPSPARAVAEGHYGPLEIRKNEASLMKTVSDYEDLFMRRGYRYSSPDLEQAVERVGARLAPAPTDPYIRYRFHVLRDPEVNAFALPDGQVYVNTGALAAMRNEAQLASILAHEVNHTAGHHGILEYRSVRRKVVTSMVLGPFTLGLSDIFLALSIYGYSRDLEEEADHRGLQRMLEAGYDPREMSKLFDILAQDPEEEKPKRATAWSTHPQLAARSTYTRAEAEEMVAHVDTSSLRVEGPSFRRLVRRVSLLTVQDLIAADEPRTACALARRLADEEPADPDRWVALGDATQALGARSAPGGEETATNREKKENLEERRKLTRAEWEAERRALPGGEDNLRANLTAACGFYRRALEMAPDHPEAHRGLGLALQGLHDPAGAGREFVVYLRARPDALDRPIILGHLREVTEALRKGGPNHDAKTNP